MDTKWKTADPPRILDKDEVRELMKRVRRQLGVPDELLDERPHISAEELQERMLARGVRPEDNAASRELYRMR